MKKIEEILKELDQFFADNKAKKTKKFVRFLVRFSLLRSLISERDKEVSR